MCRDGTMEHVFCILEGGVLADVVVWSYLYPVQYRGTGGGGWEEGRGGLGATWKGLLSHLPSPDTS